MLSFSFRGDAWMNDMLAVNPHQVLQHLLNLPYRTLLKAPVLSSTLG